MNSTASTTRSRFKTFGWIALFVVAALIAVLLAGVYFALKPNNFTPLLLERIGRATGLEITAKGRTEINWRGTPYIVLRDVEAHAVGERTALLTAARIKIAMPWVTLKSRGQTLVVDRVELDAPVLDLAAFRRWQDARPKTTSQIPEFKHGISVKRGQVVGQGWRVEAFDLDVPYFSMQKPVQGHLSGQFSNDSVRMQFDLGAALTRPASGAGFALNGSASIFSGDWALATRPRLQGVLALDKGDVRLHQGTLGAYAEYRTGTHILPMALGLHGDWQLNSTGLQLVPAQVALRGKDKIPTLDATGHVRFGHEIDVALEGTLAQWPASWPALPSPLNQHTGGRAFALNYQGDAGLSAPFELQLRQPGLEFAGKFEAREVLAWTQASDQGTPIPPIQGRLKASRLDVGDIRLEGVEIDVDDK